MKNILKQLLLCMVVLGLSGCFELELANPNQATEASFWKTEEDLYQGLIATYDQLQTGGMYGVDQRLYAILLSDEGTNEAPWEFNDLARFTLDDLNYGETWWSANYELIGRAYQVIDRSEGVSGSSVARITAEAKFLAALGYYNLINAFGDNIAYVDQIQNAADRPVRAENGELWALAEDLLKTAIPNLPLASAIGTSGYGRISKGAAQSLLAKVHMQQKEYADAEPLLATVIQSGEYQLLANFEDNFLELGDINAEAIFQVNFLHNGVESETDNAFGFKLMSFGEAQGAYGDVQAQNVVRDSFLKELDADGNQDSRMNATLFWDGTDRLYYSQTHTWWSENAEVFNPDVNTAFMKYSEQDAVNANDNGNQALQQNGGTDFIVIRYADILLLYAETLNELGSTTEAYQYIDQVRQRSNMAPLSTAKPGLSQSALLAQLKHERLLELACEAVRFFDLKRWGDWGPNSAVNDSNFATFTVGQDEYFPIPQTELDLNENLRQNPGY